MTASSTVLLGPGAGETYCLPHGNVTVKATADQVAGGACSIWEGTAEPQRGGPPPHIHTREAEAFYILEGSLCLTTVYGAVEAQAGTFVYLPKGALHTFCCEGERPARMLGFAFPGGFERFFPRVGEPVAASPQGKEAEIAPSLAAFIAKATAASSEFGVKVRQPNAAESRDTLTEEPVRLFPTAQGERLGILGARMVRIAQMKNADADFALYENIVPPQAGVPLHWHSREDETFYVLDGEITFLLPDGSPTTAPAGTLLHSPKGTPHGFFNRTNWPVRLLTLITPGENMGELFRAIASPAAPTDADLARPAPAPSPEEGAGVAAACLPFGVTFL